MNLRGTLGRQKRRMEILAALALVLLGILSAAGCGAASPIAAEQAIEPTRTPNRFTVTAQYIYGNATAQALIPIQQMTLAAEENSISESYRRCTLEAQNLTAAVSTAAVYKRSPEPTQTATPQPPALSPADSTAAAMGLWLQTQAPPTLTIQAITLQAAEFHAAGERRVMGWLSVGVTLMVIALVFLIILLLANLLCQRSFRLAPQTPLPPHREFDPRSSKDVILAVVPWEKTVSWLKDAQAQHAQRKEGKSRG